MTYVLQDIPPATLCAFNFRLKVRELEIFHMMSTADNEVALTAIRAQGSGQCC